MELERQERILEYLRGHERLTIAEATARFGISDVTARRDFRALHEQGLVRRTRGAILPQTTQSIQPFALREAHHSSAKESLARAAADLLGPREVAIIDGGTTTFHLSRCLPDFPMRVVTNSVRLAAGIEERRGPRAWPEIHLTGGLLYPESGLLLGPATVRDLASCRAQWTLLSVGGIDAEGITNTHELVVEVEQVMIERGERVVVLADRGKLGHSAMNRVCGLDRIDLLITDAREAETPVLTEIRQAGVQVIEVD